MTCTQLQTRLQDYARGTMSAEEESAFETHLDSCEDCSTIVALAGPELRHAGTLPRTVPPVQDLWPAIQARIEPARIAGRIAMPRWTLAAAAVLLIAASSAVTAVILRQAGQSAAQSSTHLVGFEAEYSAASEELTAALAAARGRLAPETILTIERNLSLIDNALAESRRALAADPGNVALEQLVVAAWRQKVDLLRRAAMLSGES
jgi:anti-sigma-K factor RskA